MLHLNGNVRDACQGILKNLTTWDKSPKDRPFPVEKVSEWHKHMTWGVTDLLLPQSKFKYIKRKKMGVANWHATAERTLSCEQPTEHRDHHQWQHHAALNSWFLAIPRYADPTEHSDIVEAFQRYGSIQFSERFDPARWPKEVEGSNLIKQRLERDKEGGLKLEYIICLLFLILLWFAEWVK